MNGSVTSTSTVPAIRPLCAFVWGAGSGPQGGSGRGLCPLPCADEFGLDDTHQEGWGGEGSTPLSKRSREPDPCILPGSWRRLGGPLVPCPPCRPTTQHPWGKEKSSVPCLPPQAPARGPCLLDWGLRGSLGPECHSLPHPPLTSLPPACHHCLTPPSPQPPLSGAVSGPHPICVSHSVPSRVCLPLSPSSRVSRLVFLSLCLSLPFLLPPKPPLSPF